MSQDLCDGALSEVCIEERVTREKSDHKAATDEDAGVLLPLLGLDVEMGLDDAMRAVFSPSFDAENASRDRSARSSSSARPWVFS